VCIPNVAKVTKTALRLLQTAVNLTVLPFSPISPNKMVAKIFPQFSVGDKLIESVSSFKYLGHIDGR